MGLVLDTSVFIRAERSGLPNFSSWINHGEVFISVMTVSERLVGVHRADNESRRARRCAFVEAIIARLPILDSLPKSLASTPACMQSLPGKVN